MNAEFLVVAHRLPLKLENNCLIPTDGGLASALRSAQLEDRARWVGSLGENVPDDYLTQLPNHCAHVEMSKETYDGFYNGFSNSVLWPAFHDRLDLVKYKDSDWSAYFDANSKFADKIFSTGTSLPVWIHDYQLMLVPLLVKLHEPKRKVCFFLHIPWPRLEIAQKIPRLSEIVRSLAKCDSVCVHTEEYAENLRDFYNYAVGDQDPRQKELNIQVVPIGIAPEQFSLDDFSEKALEWNNKKVQWKGLNIVGVDRLDYSKGIDHKLRVFAEFLELFPEWRGRVSLRQLLIPTRDDVTAYKHYRDEVFQLINYINQKFGTTDWKPIDACYGRTCLENLKQIYARGDICWISSLKDGMNLVALEYTAAQNPEEPGVLLLSNQAGCSHHLQGALIYDGLSETASFKALKQALQMSDSERRVRHRRDMAWVKNHSVGDWVQRNLDLLLPEKKSPKTNIRKFSEVKDSGIARSPQV